MTTIENFEKKCAVCAKTSEHPVIMSTSSWGYPDLDLRPSEMKRSTMHMWVEECPHCGYVASSIENRMEAPCEILKTDAYLTCEGNEFKSNLAKKFYKSYLIFKADDDYGSGFFSLHHCAWACDDSDDEELAAKMRKMALECIDNVKIGSEHGNTTKILIKADLLRRSGQFDEVISQFKDMILEDRLENDVLTFQIELAMKEDAGCYTVDDVINEKQQGN